MPPTPSGFMPEASHINRRVNQAEVDRICAKHDRLFSSRPGGARAMLSWTDLSGLDLRGRNLCDADFSGASLAECQMQGVRLDHALRELAHGRAESLVVGR